MRLIIAIPILAAAFAIVFVLFRVCAPASAVAALDRGGPRDWTSLAMAAAAIFALILL